MSLADPSRLPTSTSPKNWLSNLGALLAQVPGLVWVYAVIAIGLTFWGLSIALFGVPGLYMPAVALVPVAFAALLLISRG